MTRDWLAKLYAHTAELRAHNEAAHAEVVANRARRAREKAEQQQRWEAKRGALQARIRDALGSVERWSRSEAHALITDYLSDYLRGRIDVNTNVTVPARLLVRWQCVVYFDFIAGQSKPFGVRDACHQIVRREVNMGQPDAFELIAIHLYKLETAGYLKRTAPYGKFPVFVATESGAWW